MVSCKDYVEMRKSQLKDEVSKFDKKPHLAVLQIGNNPASNTYIKNKKLACEEVGIEFTHINLPDTVHRSDVVNTLLMIAEVADGILLQLPIPDHLDVDDLLRFIPPSKDVDGFTRVSEFNPCTPKGIIDYLKYNNIKLRGKHVVILGRSKIVGLPLTNMMIHEGATVTCCNSKTKYLKRITRQADIIVSAIGKPKHLTSKYFKDDQIVIDVGINRDENGKLCGDVDYNEVMDTYAIHVTPVPGGVGKLTVCSLLENVVEAYKGKINGNDRD